MTSYFQKEKCSLMLCLILLLAPTINYAQGYYHHIKAADSLSTQKRYRESVQHYKLAFKKSDRCMYHFYAAACAASLANENKQALQWLNHLIDLGYDNAMNLARDSSLLNLQKQKGWKTLMAKAKSKKENIRHPHIQKKLDSMFTLDQKYRFAETEMIGKYGTGSAEYAAAIRNTRLTDSLNYLVLKKWVEQYGFLGFSEVGRQAANQFWTLVQHSDKHVDFQKYVLAEMKKCVERSNCDPSDYAYLVDRVAVNTKQLQTYGTQMQLNHDSTSYEPKPMMDAANVNTRRAMLGIMMSEEEYINLMNQLNQVRLKKPKK